MADTRHVLLTDISRVIHALPELADMSGLLERFSVDRLDDSLARQVLRRQGEIELAKYDVS